MEKFRIFFSGRLHWFIIFCAVIFLIGNAQISALAGDPPDDAAEEQAQRAADQAAEQAAQQAADQAAEQAAQQAADQAAEQAAQQAADQAAEQAAQQAADQAAEQAAQQAADQAAEQAAQQAADQAAEQAAQQAADQAAEQAAQQAADQAAEQAAQQAADQAAEQAAQQAADQAAEQAAQQAADQAAEQAAQQAADQAAEQAAQQAADQAAEQAAQQAADQAAEQAAQQAADEAAQQAADEAAQQAADEAAQRAADEAAQQAADEAAQQAADEAAQQAADEAAQQAADEAAQQAADEAAQQAADEAAQQAADEAAQQAADEAAQQAADEAAQQAADEAAQQAADEAAQHAADEAAQQAADDAAQQAADKAAHEAEEAAQRAADEASQRTAEDAAEHAAHEVVEQAAERAGQEAEKAVVPVVERTEGNSLEQTENETGNEAEETSEQAENETEETSERAGNEAEEKNNSEEKSLSLAGHGRAVKEKSTSVNRTLDTLASTMDRHREFSGIFDDHGAEAISEEILVLAEKAADLDKDENYSVKGQQYLEGLDMVLTRLEASKDKKLSQSASEMSGGMIDANADLNHLFSPETSNISSSRPTYSQVDFASKHNLTNHDTTKIHIGLIDTMVERSHVALRGKTIIVKDFVPYDRTRPEGHGTAVASLLVGHEPSVFRGLVPGARLSAASVFFRLPSGKIAATTESLILALDWLVQQKVQVINMSLSGPPNRLLEMAIRRVAEKGVITVAAVGNAGPAAAPLFPAAYPGVVAVTAVDKNHQVYLRANRGHHVAFSAPGVNISAARSGGGYQSLTGTSIATPFVSAILADQANINRSLNQDELLKILKENTIDLGKAGFDDIYGYGLIQTAAH